jgi:hypothetical protein
VAVSLCAAVAVPVPMRELDDPLSIDLLHEQRRARSYRCCSRPRLPCRSCRC